MNYQLFDLQNLNLEKEKEEQAACFHSANQRQRDQGTIAINSGLKRRDTFPYDDVHNLNQKLQQLGLLNINFRIDSSREIIRNIRVVQELIQKHDYVLSNNHKLKSQLTYFKTKCSQKEREIQKLQTENLKLQYSLDKISCDRDKLHNKSFDDVKRLTEENKKLQKQLKGLTIKVQEYKRQLAEKSTIIAKAKYAQISEKPKSTKQIQEEELFRRKQDEIKKHNIEVCENIKEQISAGFNQKLAILIKQNKFCKRLIHRVFNQFNKTLRFFEVYQSVLYGGYSVDQFQERNYMEIKYNSSNDCRYILKSFQNCCQTLIQKIHSRTNQGQQTGKILKQNQRLHQILQYLTPTLERLIKSSQIYRPSYQHLSNTKTQGMSKLQATKSKIFAYKQYLDKENIGINTVLQNFRAKQNEINCRSIPNFNEYIQHLNKIMKANGIYRQEEGVSSI